MAKPDTRDLEPSIDALYQAPLDRFTAERNALAAALKKAGDKAAAERVKSLTKPSTTAWAINQVWWKHRDRFEAMLEAGAAQRKAHLALAQGRKADLRSAGDARRDAVSSVAEAAFDVLGGRHRVAPDVQYRITGTLEALASSGVPEGEAPGRLTGDLQSSGLDALAALAGAAGAAPRPTLVARGTPAASREAGTPAAARHEAHPARTAPAAGGQVQPAEGKQSARERKARAAADAAARTRAAEAAAAEAQLAELSTALEAAERAVAETAGTEAEARRALDQAAARRKELESALDEARAAEAAARRALSSATAAASRATMDRGRAAKDVARAREAVDRLTR